MFDPADRRKPENLRSVIGHESAKRALEIALAGGHHLLLVGPAGVGKSLLLSCVEGLLPDPAPAVLLLDDLRSAGHGRLAEIAARMDREQGDLLVVGTLTPCPCGSGGWGKVCDCRPWRVRRHWQPIEGMLHLFAMMVFLDARAPRTLIPTGEESGHVRERIAAARAIARARQGVLNSVVTGRDLLAEALLDPKKGALLQAARDQAEYSLGQIDTALRIARTVADLHGGEMRIADLAEALGYRPQFVAPQA